MSEVPSLADAFNELKSRAAEQFPSPGRLRGEYERLEFHEIAQKVVFERGIKQSAENPYLVFRRKIFFAP